MIKQYNGFKAEKSIEGGLPVEAYICRIVGAAVRKSANTGSEYLAVAFDISEGAYAGYFSNLYANRTSEDAKYKGILNVMIPVEGTQWFESQKKQFNNLIYAVEESNKGFHFDWDESKLKNQFIGILFRNEEWEWEGKTGWNVKPFKALSVDDVKTGNYKIPKDKTLKKPETNTAPAPAYTNASFNPAELSDDDIPF